MTTLGCVKKVAKTSGNSRGAGFVCPAKLRRKAAAQRGAMPPPPVATLCSLFSATLSPSLQVEPVVVVVDETGTPLARAACLFAALLVGRSGPGEVARCSVGAGDRDEARVDERAEAGRGTPPSRWPLLVDEGKRMGSIVVPIRCGAEVVATAHSPARAVVERH